MSRNKRGKIPQSQEAPADGVEFGFLADLIGFHLRFAAVAVFRDFKQMVGDDGITQHQHGVLQIIALNPASTLAQIAESLGTDRPTMVDIIKKLEERQLVRRQKSRLDGRRSELFLSDQGAAFLAEVNEKIREHEARITEGISEEDLRTAFGVLRRLHKHAF